MHNPHRNRRRPSSIKKSYPIAAYSPRNFFRGVQFSCHIQPPSFPLRFHATRREASRDHIYNNQHVICTCHDTIAAIIAILDHLYVPGKVDHSIGHDNERHDHQHQKSVYHGHLERFCVHSATSEYVQDTFSSQ